MTSERRNPPAPPGSERRKHERLELMAQIELRHDGELWVLPVRNVSAGGMLVGLGAAELEALSPGDRVDVYLALDGPLGASVELRAMADVVRVNAGAPGRDPSAGLKWVGDDPALMESLTNLIAFVRAIDG